MLFIEQNCAKYNLKNKVQYQLITCIIQEDDVQFIKTPSVQYKELVKEYKKNSSSSKSTYQKTLTKYNPQKKTPH